MVVSNNQEKILERLEISRKDLLDLGLRNSLLNFRSTARSLEIIDELSSELSRILVVDQKKMSFLPLVDSRMEQSEDVDELEFDFDDMFGESADEEGVAKRHTDTRLQTRRTPDVLLKTLLKINTEARSYIEEQGINVLYLALGFLEWYEAAGAQTPRNAPLILIPVELSRSTAKDTFKISYTGEDLEPNLSLEAKLRSDFGLSLPGFNDEEFDANSYFASVQQAVASMDQWEVKPDRMYLGFFSFGKFRMYKDLQEESWPNESNVLNHVVLNSLLGDGFPESEPRFPEDEHLDKHVDPAECHFVKDSDSTQTIATLEVMTGKNMVIQGPPGTGKSQTITNIIAECVGQGKTVLFVAEKMAALEVVKRRLDDVHIGDLVLELHSHKSNKKAVIEELSRTLNLGKPLVDDDADDLKSLRECQERLNAYCEEANIPILNSGVNFVQALGNCLKLKKNGAKLPRFTFEQMKSWTGTDFRDKLELIDELADFINQNGTPTHNRFSLSGRRSFSPAQKDNLKESIVATRTQLKATRTLAEPLKARLGFKSPKIIHDLSVLVRSAQRAFEAPQLHGMLITSDEWQHKQNEIVSLIDSGKKIVAIKAEWSSVFIDAAWKTDLLKVRQAFITVGGKWWRFLSGVYRKAKAELLGLCRSELPGDNTACLKAIDSVLEVQSNLELFETHQGMGKSLFGNHWEGLDSNWDALTELNEWIATLKTEIIQGQIHADLLAFLSGEENKDGLCEATQALEEACNKTKKNLSETCKILVVNESVLSSLPLDELLIKLNDWCEHLDDMYQQVRYRQLQDELKNKEVDFIVPDVDEWSLSGQDFIDAFKLTFYEGFVDLAYETRPELTKFDRVAQEKRIDRFRMLDQLQLVHAQGRLAIKHFGLIPRLSGGGQIGVINREINKKRKHLPIRKLLEDAGEAIQQFKPVFMMSPMSIAQYLKPGVVQFDVVIFDEASQVKAIDAFGAILRGKQVVVVGDTKQMPPTDFFGRSYDSEEEEESVTNDIESILGLFLAKGSHQSMLQWHYRSRHESLIAVSNYEFYENKLVVFPSSGTNTKATGLHFHHLPDTIYDRGKSSTNKEEALAVAEAIMTHAQENPDLTLGVVAFSTGQRDMITLQLEQLRRHDDRCERFFSDHFEEPFFIKNLENVQGDERDVIMISVGYGKDVNGKLGYNFGPLNKDGGHRRLNVLISRAKQVMHVFSNFTGNDLQVKDTSSLGIQALKHFLQYAETGKLQIPVETGKAPDSPFEEEVIAALRDAGYLVEPQVGTAGYFIDIAIIDPEKPGRYLLAIECDGASYHSSRSARDRDRLRQSVLEGLGWRFYRIWSTDWFRNPSAELGRVKEAIEQAKQADHVDSESAIDVNLRNLERSDASVQSVKIETNPYETVAVSCPTSEEIHEAPTFRVAKLIDKVVAVEAPIHIDVVTRRMLDAFGITRAGNRVKVAIADAVRHGVNSSMFEQKNGFLYKPNQREFVYRNRENLETAERKISYVAPEEFNHAITEVVSNAIGIEIDYLIDEVLNLLGFKRATKNMYETVENHVQDLVSQNVLIVQNSGYRLVK